MMNFVWTADFGSALLHKETIALARVVHTDAPFGMAHARDDTGHEKTMNIKGNIKSMLGKEYAKLFYGSFDDSPVSTVKGSFKFLA
jgi:hypothetical protein